MGRADYPDFRALTLSFEAFGAGHYQRRDTELDGPLVRSRMALLMSALLDWGQRAELLGGLSL